MARATRRPPLVSSAAWWLAAPDADPQPPLKYSRQPRGRGRIDRLVRRGRRQVVQRAVVHERLDRHVAHHLRAVEDAEATGVRHVSHHRGTDLPAGADLLHLPQVARLDHAEHPLL